MTIVLFFSVPVDDYTILVDHVPTMEAAFETGMAYTTEPDFLGSTIIPTDDLIAFDANHVFEVLTQANELA
jgi:hypothetical protein